MQSIIYEFDPVIYPYTLLVSKKFDSKDLAERFYVLNTEYDLAEADGRDFVPNPQTIARTLFVVSKKTMYRHVLILLVRPNVIYEGNITQESLHATNMIAEALGFLPEKTSEDEPCAYLSQWIANCIAYVKRGHPEVMKGEKYEA